MALTHKINQLLEKYFHIKLTPSRPIKTLTQITGHQPNIILEFMGASGVGKTTLRNHFLTHTQLSLPKNLLTEKEVREFDWKPTDQKLIAMDFYNQLLVTKLNQIAKNKVDIFKMHRQLDLFFNTLKADGMVRYYLPKGMVVLDQHVFKFFTENYLALPPSSAKKEFLNNRFIIYCYATPEVILQYIEKRKKKGKIRLGHQGKSRAEITSQIQLHLEQRARDIQLLKEQGAQILEVNTANDMDKNRVLIDDFLQEHLNFE